MNDAPANRELIDIILASNQGRTAAALAMAGGYSVDSAEKALKTQVREIGSKIALKAREPEELELLLDVIEAGEHDDYLTNPDALLSREAIEEGEEILAHVYGSVDRARTIARSLRRPHGLTEEKMERMMTLAATLCVAGLVQRGRQGFMAAEVSGAGSVFWKELFKAVYKGVTYVPPKRRKRRSRSTYAKSYKTSAKRKRQRRRSKRKTTPSLADVFGELIKRAI
ncbi:MAG: DUF937 domain-containing protein [Anderseniella sp.]|jgi:hypothetical protein|nr:DUF937 domain-containing protein [Anderseniella sp.]